MRQILQHLGTGITELAEVPCPNVGRGQLLIRTTRSLISAGTERMLLDFGRANLLDKARQQPQRVKAVLDKVRSDGLLPTIDAVRDKLDQPVPLGYCNVGVVLELGPDVRGFAVGDRVASNGKHAEVVAVPLNLCARVPDAVHDDAAAFTVIGAIALQGIRLVEPTLGESVAVIGLGLIGLMTVQLLRAHGCRVLGVDLDPAKLRLAERFGAEVVDLTAGQDPVRAAERFSRGRGVDAVIIAAATKSSQPVHQAALMSRKRGRIVLVGVAGLELKRDDFYTKELTFQVSCSYGPGRYDPSYESGGNDYPIAFVRWTEQRNLEAVLDMMADGRLDVAPLISHRFALEQAAEAYEVIGGTEPSLGVLLQYTDPATTSDDTLRARRVRLTSTAIPRPAPSVAFIGAGNYATRTLIPAFRAAGAHLSVVASNSGASGVHAGRRFRFDETTTDADSVLRASTVDAVVVTTRHDTHARFVIRALQARKHVFVEKPLCLSSAELEEIERAYTSVASPGPAPLLMVGFNRRFAPHVARMKTLLASTHSPRAFVVTVNAGALPADHWTQDPRAGGGRIKGEACHFIDLLRFLAGSPIAWYARTSMADSANDTATLQLRFVDGSIGSVHYLANGSKAFPKERVEVFAGGGVLQLDNFRTLTGYGWKGFSRMKLWRQDKGQDACAAAFLHALRDGGESPIPFEEIVEVARVTIALGDAP